MEGYSNKGRTKEFRRKRQEIFSKVVRAGKRTYFIDVKCTRNDEFYLTITESKRHFENEGKFHYEKHKIFLYKEDFRKFIDGLHDVIDYIYDKQPDEEYIEVNEDEVVAVSENEPENEFTDVEFEDLNN
ncbi:MAG: PUR family DNA/RNA-binding protein [Prolixibacteraceae bacterium]|nr:PUR family DNA/RNA-binding protein [Prolixibacteraceae bacterium]